MNSNHPLLQPIKLGPYELPNRVAMAPLTRRRASEGGVPNKMMAEYYGQRASAGLIMAEASPISRQGTGYPDVPGIYTQKQINGWKLVTDAVHEKGGRIFLQLWHVGRFSHYDFQPGGKAPVAPSAIPFRGRQINTGKNGHQETPVPHALTVPEINSIVEDYRQAAKNAREAGFDGVELHAANGYLVDQFLNDISNVRTDNYGGSFGNRYRFLAEVLDALCEVWGNEKVGVRLAPGGGSLGMRDSDPLGLFSYVISRLNAFKLAYLSILQQWFDVEDYPKELKNLTPYFRKFYDGLLITNHGFDFEKANEYIEKGHADMVAFGAWYISNPDLVERFAAGAPINEPDKDTYYGGNEKGYTDYRRWDSNK
jgi:N-ethylmaleimide reductase